MSPRRPPVNVAASVRARLLGLSRQQKVEFKLVLSEFAIERLLYRLGTSPHADRFVLKGAMERQTQWRAFLRRGRLEAPLDTGELADGLRRFLGPVLAAAARGETLSASWRPGGPWEAAA